MFQCERCGCEMSTKGNLLAHLRRKYVCPPTLSDIPPDSLIEDLTKKTYNDTAYECQHCHKFFNNYQNRWRHYKICPKKDSEDDTSIADIKTKLDHVMKELQVHKDTQNNVITINNNQNITNQTLNNTTQAALTRPIRNFGNENMMAVPDQFLRSSLMNLEYATLFENLHCDPDYPENHNIRIKSKKDRELEMYTQDKWKIKSFKKGIEEVMDHLNRIYEDFCNHHYEDLLEDVGEEDAEITVREIQGKCKINNDLRRDILNTLEEYRPMLNRK